MTEARARPSRRRRSGVSQPVPLPEPVEAQSCRSPIELVGLPPEGSLPVRGIDEFGELRPVRIRSIDVDTQLVLTRATFRVVLFDGLFCLDFTAFGVRVLRTNGGV